MSTISREGPTSILASAVASSPLVFSNSAASVFFSSVNASNSAGVCPPRFAFRKLRGQEPKYEE